MLETIGSKDSILLVGKMQAGKTTAAAYLVDNYGYTHMSFAAPIKQIVAIIDSMPPEKIIDILIKPYYDLRGGKRAKLIRILEATKDIPNEFPKPRKRLQFLGTDGVRKQIDDEFWLKLLWEKVKNTKKIVIDDCRFLNEYEFFKGKGYADIKISVTDETQHIRLHKLHNGPYDPEILKHQSEIEQPIIFEKYPNNIISNDGNLEEYFENIDKLLKPTKENVTER